MGPLICIAFLSFATTGVHYNNLLQNIIKLYSVYGGGGYDGWVALMRFYGLLKAIKNSKHSTGTLERILLFRNVLAICCLFQLFSMLSFIIN